MITDRLCLLIYFLFGKTLLDGIVVKPCEKNRFLLTAFLRPIITDRLIFSALRERNLLPVLLRYQKILQLAIFQKNLVFETILYVGNIYLLFNDVRLVWVYRMDTYALVYLDNVIHVCQSSPFMSK